MITNIEVWKRLNENFTREEWITRLIKKLQKEFGGKFSVKGNDVYCYNEHIYTFKNTATIFSIFSNILKLDDDTGNVMDIIRNNKSVRESLDIHKIEKMSDFELSELEIKGKLGNKYGVFSNFKNNYGKIVADFTYDELTPSGLPRSTRVFNFNSNRVKLNEALSVDRVKEARLKILVDEAKEMLKAKERAKELAELRKVKNKELQEALEEVKQSSVVAQGVLFEVIQPYEKTGLNTKEYVNFVENSVDKITKEYKEIHNKVLELAKVEKKGYSYFRTAQNKNNLEPGTIVESKFSDFINWIKSGIKKIKNKLFSFRNTLSNISDQAKQFQVNEKVYSGRKSKYKNAILSVLTNDTNLTYYTIAEKLGDMGISGKRKTVEYSTYSNLIELLNQNIVVRTKKEGHGRSYFYSLSDDVNVNDIELIDNDPNVDAQPDNDALVSILEHAKESIDLAEEQKYYEELAKSKEKRVKELMAEFNATKVAIDEKIISLVTVKDSKRVDWPKYQEMMLTAKSVDKDSKAMANSLFKMYNKVTEVKGSLRQYDDDANLPDGTFGATFDYVLKQVLAPNQNVNEGIMDVIKKIGTGLKRLFNNFFKFSNRIKKSLNNI